MAMEPREHFQVRTSTLACLIKTAIDCSATGKAQILAAYPEKESVITDALHKLQEIDLTKVGGIKRQFLNLYGNILEALGAKAPNSEENKLLVELIKTGMAGYMKEKSRDSDYSPLDISTEEALEIYDATNNEFKIRSAGRNEEGKTLFSCFYAILALAEIINKAKTEKTVIINDLTLGK